MGDYPAAEDTIRRMMAIAQSRDAQPSMTPIFNGTQSFLAYRQGDYAQSIAYAEKALAAPNNDAAFARAFYLAPNLNKLGQAKRAETLLLEAIEPLRQSERVFDLAKLKSALGESLTQQRRFAEAEKVLLEAYEAQKARVLLQQYDMVETRRRLAELYRAWGKTDEAQKYE